MKRSISLLTAIMLPYGDVAAEARFAEAVKYAYDRGLMTGTSTAAFSPETPLTRAQLVTALWRMAGQPKSETPLPYDDLNHSEEPGIICRNESEKGVRRPCRTTIGKI